jgi:hypothetical protein
MFSHIKDAFYHQLLWFVFTQLFFWKRQPIALFRAIIDACCENHSKPKISFRGEDAELVYIRANSTYFEHQSLNEFK